MPNLPLDVFPVEWQNIRFIEISIYKRTVKPHSSAFYNAKCGALSHYLIVILSAVPVYTTDAASEL